MNNIFSKSFISDNTYNKAVLINSSSFKLKYMIIKRFLIDFDFLIIHPDENYYFINKLYIDLFNKYILSQITHNKDKQEVSWDNDEHKDSVLNLANNLAENGIEPILDRYELRPGANAPYFMETALKESDKVLIIFTENYQTEAIGRRGGVGYEYSILNAEICKILRIIKNIYPY